MEVIKLRGIENTKDNWSKLFESKKIFIFKYKRVYQLNYNENSGYYLQEFDYLRKFKGELPYTKSGRFVAYNSKDANKLLGRENFVEVLEIPRGTYY